MGIIGTAFAGAVQAQDAGEPDYTSGIVKSVSGTSITIMESDSEDEAEATFMIDGNTILENIATIGEIAVGDEVYIDFVVNAQGKLAVNIYKMGLMEDSDDSADMDDAEMQETANESED